MEAKKWRAHNDFKNKWVVEKSKKKVFFHPIIIEFGPETEAHTDFKRFRKIWCNFCPWLCGFWGERFFKKKYVILIASFISQLTVFFLSPYRIHPAVDVAYRIFENGWSPKDRFFSWKSPSCWVT
jgi:hypothetical protein